jgi:hypothetical protein
MILIKKSDVYFENNFIGGYQLTDRKIGAKLYHRTLAPSIQDQFKRFFYLI